MLSRVEPVWGNAGSPGSKMGGGQNWGNIVYGKRSTPNFVLGRVTRLGAHMAADVFMSSVLYIPTPIALSLCLYVSTLHARFWPFVFLM